MSDAEDKKEAKTEAKPFNEQDRCFRCGIKGHYSYDCSQFHGLTSQSEKRKAKPKSFDTEDTCYECGKTGHYAYDCEKRLIRERKGEYKKGEQPRGRASPTYDEYDGDTVPKGQKTVRKRSRSRSRSPIDRKTPIDRNNKNFQPPIEEAQPPLSPGIKLKRKSKNVQNIRSLWNL